MSAQIKEVESYGYKVVTRAEFFAATTDLTEWLTLRDRATVVDGAFVVWDPEDDSDGWLLIGDDVEALAHETLEHING